MFNFAIPRATFKPDAIRGTDGNLIHTLKRIRPCRRKTSLGSIKRRIIVRKKMPDGSEYEYHATKGWRSFRA